MKSRTAKNQSPRKVIGVFFGSRSPEHDISIITGQLIIAELKKMGYPVVPVYIGKGGQWYLSDVLGSLKFFTEGAFEDTLHDRGFSAYYLDVEQSRGRLVFKQKGVLGKTTAIDIAFPALHGSFGEDGTVQGLFEMFDLPYVGCDVPSSALALDKVLTKLLYRAEGIPTTDFIFFTAEEWQLGKTVLLEHIRKKLMPPVFVKPARLGSSIGIAKIKNLNSRDLEYHIEVALHYDRKILVEQGIEQVIDLTCAILGENDDLTSSLLQEAVFENDLLDFEEKYLKEGGTQLGKAKSHLNIPAHLDNVTSETIRSLSKTIYRLFGCSGTARVDFLYDKTTKKYFANEINPLPGTLYHHLWKASGLEFSAVIGKLLAVALDRHQRRSSQIYTFSSSVLTQAGSIKLSQRIK